MIHLELWSGKEINLSLSDISCTTLFSNEKSKIKKRKGPKKGAIVKKLAEVFFCLDFVSAWFVPAKRTCSHCVAIFFDTCSSDGICIRNIIKD